VNVFNIEYIEITFYIVAFNVATILKQQIIEQINIKVTHLDAVHDILGLEGLNVIIFS